ncbi:MAG: putative molybdenum carrier protein [Rhodothermales bacterium]|nr:putative molybdenum carrier protein [Rhodothermales bacterium]
MPPPIKTLISGGQTGVDRAALDAAQATGIPVAGWCPRGRRAEDGEVPARYPLHETPSGAYAERTAWNVRDGEATLILHAGAVEGGTAFTAEEARRLGRPLLMVDLREGPVETVRVWLAEHAVTVLNVAGPRESEAPGIYMQARRFMERLLARA